MIFCILILYSIDVPAHIGHCLREVILGTTCKNVFRLGRDTIGKQKPEYVGVYVQFNPITLSTIYPSLRVQLLLSFMKHIKNGIFLGPSLYYICTLLSHLHLIRTRYTFWRPRPTPYKDALRKCFQ